MHQGQAGAPPAAAPAGRARPAPRLGAMAVTFYMVLTLSGANDVIADKFHISLNAMTWAGRIGLLVAAAAGVLRHLPDLPGPAAARPGGAGARRRDRHHPAPAGRPVRRDAPAARPADDARPRASWTTPAGPVPKKMNRLGALAPGHQGLLLPDREAGRGAGLARAPAGRARGRARGDRQRREPPLTARRTVRGARRIPAGATSYPHRRPIRPGVGRPRRDRSTPRDGRSQE